MKPHELSGLQLVQAMLRGEIPHPSMTDTLPMRVIAAERGHVRFSARADARHLNPLGGVHGGFAATVLDSVTGSAVHTMLDAGVRYGTVDLHVKLLKPVPVDEELIAEGKVIHMSRNLGVSEGTLRNAAGALLAHATSTCVLLRQPSAEAASETGQD